MFIVLADTALPHAAAAAFPCVSASSAHGGP
jgi:hypothetical protein